MLKYYTMFVQESNELFWWTCYVKELELITGREITLKTGNKFLSTISLNMSLTAIGSSDHWKNRLAKPIPIPSRTECLSYFLVWRKWTVIRLRPERPKSWVAHHCRLLPVFDLSWGDRVSSLFHCDWLS